MSDPTVAYLFANIYVADTDMTCDDDQPDCVLLSLTAQDIARIDHAAFQTRINCDILGTLDITMTYGCLETVTASYAGIDLEMIDPAIGNTFSDLLTIGDNANGQEYCVIGHLDERFNRVEGLIEALQPYAIENQDEYMSITVDAKSFSIIWDSEYARTMYSNGIKIDRLYEKITIAN